MADTARLAACCGVGRPGISRYEPRLIEIWPHRAVKRSASPAEEMAFIDNAKVERWVNMLKMRAHNSDEGQLAFCER